MRNSGDPLSSGDKGDTGRNGEDLAARYLQGRGCVILARNWRASPGEIDIVARCPSGMSQAAFSGSGPLTDTNRDVLAFIEVRTRHGASGLAEESVSRRKATSMASAAISYLTAHHLDPDGTPWRIDLIAIAVSPDGRSSINWIKGAISEDMVE